MRSALDEKNQGPGLSSTVLVRFGMRFWGGVRKQVRTCETMMLEVWTCEQSCVTKGCGGQCRCRCSTGRATPLTLQAGWVQSHSGNNRVVG